MSCKHHVRSKYSVSTYVSIICREKKFFKKLKKIKGKRNTPSKSSALAELQNDLFGVKNLIPDQFSFIGQKMFAWISRRCNEATGFNATPFHCISITLVEIIGQLPSITDQVLYHNVLALYQNKKHQTIRVRKLFLLYNNRSCWISTSSQ